MKIKIRKERKDGNIKWTLQDDDDSWNDSACAWKWKFYLLFNLEMRI